MHRLAMNTIYTVFFYCIYTMCLACLLFGFVAKAKSILQLQWILMVFNVIYHLLIYDP